MAKRKKYIMVLEPVDEFLSPVFTALKRANEYKDGMMEAYKRQGYYSTSSREHIPFEELKAEIVPV